MPHIPAESQGPAVVQPQPRGRVATLVELGRLKLASLWREAAKFGAIGLIALVIDVGLFNLLMFAGGAGPMAGKPLTAKVISVIAATTFAYFGNRFWTFRHRARTSYTREYVLFFVLNFVGMGIALGCLWFSHYALGLTSAIADNISANVIGLALGTLFRFWSYRKWVFPEAEITNKELIQLSEV
ncbi:MAG: GtrA family protein [Candidatus Nanopelagicales bacterium]|nr:GtrA family protein [Candidatus Nanopelagicales bacterium]